MPIQKRGGSAPAAAPAKVLTLKHSNSTVSPKNKPNSFSLKGTEIEAVLGQINKGMGAEVARFLNTKRAWEPRIRSGIFALDLSLAGGLLTSRGAMLYGEKSTGKTTTAMMFCVEAQRKYPDMICVWIDIEGTFDMTWFIKLGGDVDRFLLVEPESGEHAVDIADAMMKTKEVAVLVTDSIAMLTPMKEIEGSAEDSLPGIHARLVGGFIRKTNNAMLVERHRGHRPINLFLNQFRMKIGVTFGDPRTLPGGKALEFATSTQIQTRNKEKISDAGDVLFNEHNFTITKEKTGAGRLREIKFKLVRDPASNRGLPDGTIDQMKTVLEFGTRIGRVANPSSGRYEIEGFGSFHGADKASDFFLSDPEAYARLQIDIIDGFRKEWGLPVDH